MVAWALIGYNTLDLFKALTIKPVFTSRKQIRQLKWTFTLLYICIVNDHRTASKQHFQWTIADDASNMSRRYNGSQAKFKKLVGEEHIIFVHCYNHFY